MSNIVIRLIRFVSVHVITFWKNTVFNVKWFLWEIRSGRMFRKEPLSVTQQEELAELAFDGVDMTLLGRHIRLANALDLIWSVIYPNDSHLGKPSASAFALTFKATLEDFPDVLKRLFESDITFTDVEVFVATLDKIPYNKDRGLIKPKLDFANNPEWNEKYNRFQKIGFFETLKKEK